MSKSLIALVAGALIIPLYILAALFVEATQPPKPPFVLTCPVTFRAVYDNIIVSEQNETIEFESPGWRRSTFSDWLMPHPRNVEKEWNGGYIAKVDRFVESTELEVNARLMGVLGLEKMGFESLFHVNRFGWEEGTLESDTVPQYQYWVDPSDPPVCSTEWVVIRSVELRPMTTSQQSSWTISANRTNDVLYITVESHHGKAEVALQPTDYRIILPGIANSTTGDGGSRFSWTDLEGQEVVTRIKEHVSK